MAKSESFIFLEILLKILISTFDSLGIEINFDKEGNSGEPTFELVE